MSITWLVQDNLGSTSSTASIIKRACENDGQKYVPIQVIPFSDSLPEMPEIEGKFVIYGRTTLILNAHADKKWRKGVFFNPYSFTPEAYIEHWGLNMLNPDSKVIQIRDIPKLNFAMNHKLFIRPNDDLKRFSGGVMDYESMLGMHNNSTEDENEPVNLNTKIVVAGVKNIDREYRLFMVNGKFVTGSQYIPSLSSFVPEEVINFANTSAKLWTPADVFVMDIAAVGRSLKIIECNCFNGSGFYDSDVDLLIRSVSKFVVLS